jgi:hypothetical protein
MSSSNKHLTITPVAKSVPYDDTIQAPLSGTYNVQDILDWLKNRVATSASPGFTWGRSGNVNQNTWLLNDSVPSNLSGRICFLQSASIRNVFIANEDATAGIIIEVYTHDGDENNLTLLGSVTTIAARSHTFSVNYPVAQNKQIALKISNTSVNAKNLVAGCLLFGDIV